MVSFDDLCACAATVRDALAAKGFDSELGRGRRAQHVVVRHATKEIRGEVDRIVQQVADPLCGDLREFQTYFVIIIRDERAVMFRERFIARNGGDVMVQRPDGVLERMIGVDGVPKPLANSIGQYDP